MSATRWMQVAVMSSALAVSSLALAGGANAQNHHCKLPDGTMDAKKTHKQCTAAKGTWLKDAPSDTAKPAPAPKK
jgi:hypothetical protein